MGYSYEGRKLCCDMCSTAGARKHRCPFGWCQALALCPTCKKTGQYTTAETHRAHGCEASAARAAREATERKNMIDAGLFVRCAALAVDGDKVHVLFTGKGGATIGFYMSHAAYDAFPLLENRTPDHYRAHGELTPAPADFYTITPEPPERPQVQGPPAPAEDGAPVLTVSSDLTDWLDPDGQLRLAGLMQTT